MADVRDWRHLLSTRRRATSWLIAVAICIPLIVAPVFAVAAFERHEFVIETKIISHTNTPLEAVPLGRVEPDGKISWPPVYDSKSFFASLRLRTPYVVNDGVPIFYDYDDIDLCWLLVRSAPNAPWKVVPSALVGKSRGCVLEKPPVPLPCCLGVTEPFVVKSLDELEDAPATLTCVVDGKC
ncbi:MAG: hypothetical protein ACO1OB_20100 [Archangium sp.]